MVIDSRKDAKGDAGNIPVLKGGLVVNVKGGKRVAGVELADHTTIPCDALAMSGGWSPIVNLACHKGAKPTWNDTIAAFMPPDVGPAFTAAGSARGLMKLSECLADGAKQGAEAARSLGFDSNRHGNSSVHG